MSPKLQKYTKINMTLEVVFIASLMLSLAFEVASITFEKSVLMGPLFWTAVAFAFIAFVSVGAGISLAGKADHYRMGKLPYLHERLLSRISVHRDETRESKTGKSCSTSENGEIMATSLIQAWTTESETAVVWGTHDLEKAKEAYSKLALDTEPNWETAEHYFADPVVLHIDNWTEGNIGIKQTADRTSPFTVFDFS